MLDYKIVINIVYYLECISLPKADFEINARCQLKDNCKFMIITETATLAGGCFWCTEAIFKRLKGVISATPGFAGGTVANPTYEQVCDGNTGHVEAAQIEFDPKIIPYEKILEVFWHTHNPTELNRQGNDIGPQYRSEIFYHSDTQKKTAEKSKAALIKSDIYKEPVVTKITPFTNFYPAEDYHKNYFEKHKDQPYCTYVIDPKIQKLLAEFKKDLKEEYQT